MNQELRNMIVDQTQIMLAGMMRGHNLEVQPSASIIAIAILLYVLVLAGS